MPTSTKRRSSAKLGRLSRFGISIPEGDRDRSSDSNRNNLLVITQIQKIEQPQTDTNHCNAGNSDKRGIGGTSKNCSDAGRSQEVDSGNRTSSESHTMLSEATSLKGETASSGIEEALDSNIDHNGDQENSNDDDSQR